MLPNPKLNRVVLYSTLNCPHCRHAKAWLKKNNIPFLDFNVAKPGKIQKQFFAIGGRSVPLFVIGKEQIAGFNPQQLLEALKRQGLDQAETTAAQK
jgi:glutaredoxin